MGGIMQLESVISGQFCALIKVDGVNLFFLVFATTDFSELPPFSKPQLCEASQQGLNLLPLIIQHLLRS